MTARDGRDEGARAVGLPRAMGPPAPADNRSPGDAPHLDAGCDPDRRRLRTDHPWRDEIPTWDTAAPASLVSRDTNGYPLPRTTRLGQPTDREQDDEPH